MLEKLKFSINRNKDDKKKALFDKGVDFVNWAINEGHDIGKMAFDKAYMQRVVDMYYEDLKNKRESV